MKVCWRRRRGSSPRAAARPFGLRGLPPASASNRCPPCDQLLDVAQPPIAIAASKGLPVFSTPKHSTNSLRIAATTICLGLRRPWDFNRVTSATIAGLNRMADMAGDAAVVLLRDIRDIFEERGVDRLPSRAMVDHLTGADDAPWSEWRGYQ